VVDRHIAHPLASDLRVGYQRFSDFNPITAHNTFVVCAGELGLVGAFCWVLLTLVTVRNVFVASKDPDEEARVSAEEVGRGKLQAALLAGNSHPQRSRADTRNCSGGASNSSHLSRRHTFCAGRRTA